MGAQPECRVWNLCHGGHGDREVHNLGPKGLGPKTFGRGAWLPRCFRALNNIIRYTTKELLDITTKYATNKEAVGSLLEPGDREAVLSNSRATPSIVVVQDVKKDAKDGKKR
jgi:hypothetical protein